MSSYVAAAAGPAWTTCQLASGSEGGEVARALVSWCNSLLSLLHKSPYGMNVILNPLETSSEVMISLARDE